MIERICRDAVGEPAQHMERMTFGHCNVVYEVKTADRELIVRTNEDPAVLRGTEANLAVLLDLGLPVPKVLHADLSAAEYPFAYLVLPKIPGCDLRYALPGMTGAQMTALAGQIVSFQRIVGQLPQGSGFGWVPIGEKGPFRSWADVIERDLNKHFDQAARSLTEAEIGTLTEQAESFRGYFGQVEPRCFLDDITIKNVIMQDGELQGMIDFDSVCYGDPLYMAALTQTAVVSDVPGKDAIFYIEELCRLWGMDGRQRAIVDFYSCVHGLSFLSFYGSDPGQAEYRDRVVAFMKERLSAGRAKY
ncbi:aminoglycoside phosphotransferase family protein [Paenibacillus sp. IB182493]|uniref:Aminoglycoside phosphotransferase family protein n=2 Tax=Paenibacillus arenilitoris TaxID=2772299 RepID=A0A927CRG8_9BACL|nr:aminoglycoside phosphotransferase family protein [Paenibacillus arenilitoris]